jgi:hypothetical protein
LISLTKTGIVLTVILNILPFYVWAQEIEFSLYEDPEGRFTMDYPSKWFVSNEFSESNPAAKLSEDIAVIFGDAPEPVINEYSDIDLTTLPRVSVKISDELLGLEEYSKTLIENIGAYSVGEVKSVQSTLSGLPAYQIEYVDGLSVNAKNEIWTINDNQVYLIEYTADSKVYNYQSDLPTFQRMIDSFHITE